MCILGAKAASRGRGEVELRGNAQSQALRRHSEISKDLEEVKE